MKMPKINGSWHKDEQKGNFKNLLHKCLCRQTWNGSHREILIGKEREPLCDVAKLQQDFMVAKKALKSIKVRWGRGQGRGVGSVGG